MKLVGMIALVGALACAKREPVMTAIDPVDESLQLTATTLTPDVEKVSLQTSVLLTNRSRAPLHVVLPVSSHLEYRDGRTWRPVILFDVAPVGPPAPRPVHPNTAVGPGATLTWTVVASGNRGKGPLGTYWSGRLPGRYRLVTIAYRKVENGEGSDPVRLVSAPFELTTASK